MNPDALVRTLISDIKTRRPIVFCGAGISFNSGIPIVSSFLDCLFSKLRLSKTQIKAIQKGALPFESIMEMTGRESELSELLHVFSVGKPASAHIFLAKLIKYGYINTICTTNFDTLIEQALENEGLAKNEDFKIYSSEAEFEEIPWNTEVIKIIKIHGCITRQEEMSVTMAKIASQQFAIARKNVIENIFADGGNSQVIILGYSCSDLDLVPNIESLENNLSEILFVEHIPNSKLDIRAEQVFSKPENNPFKNYHGCRLYTDTDLLIERLWTEIFPGTYLNKGKAESSWKTWFDIWYARSEKDSGKGVRHHIASRILYAVGEFNHAIEHHKKSTGIALRDKNTLAYASEIGNMGMAFNAIGDYYQAKSCLHQSIPLCRQMNYTQGLSAQLQALGNTLHHTGDNTRAVEAYNEALEYAGDDEYTVSNILGNMANAYNRMGCFEKALLSVNKALILSRKIGNNQAESSQLGILAVSYLCQGNYDMAIAYSLQGLKIKKSIGDRHGECLMMANLTNIYANAGRKKEGLQIAEACLKLARELKNRSVEQMIKINLRLLA